MSYIRSISNPEALYIWGDNNNVTILKGHHTIGTIPVSIFNGLINKYSKSYEDCTYKGIEVKEVKVGKNFKVQLSYQDWKVNMWYVTWHYIVSSNFKKIKTY